MILEAVKQAPVPWSSTMSRICDLGAGLQHAAALEIKEQRALVSVKAIFRKYECKAVLTSGHEAERLLKLMLLKGGEAGLRDVEEVCKVMDHMNPMAVNKLYIHHLLENNKDARAAFKKVEEAAVGVGEDLYELCSDIVSRAGVNFQLEVDPGVEEAYASLLKSLITSYGSVTDTRDGSFQPFL